MTSFRCRIGKFEGLVSYKQFLIKKLSVKNNNFSDQMYVSRNLSTQPESSSYTLSFL